MTPLQRCYTETSLVRGRSLRMKDNVCPVFGLRNQSKSLGSVIDRGEGDVPRGDT